MNNDRLAISLDYLRFTIEADGETLTEKLEDTFTDILKDNVKADKVIAEYIRENGLEAADLAGQDEMGRYPGTRCIVNYFGIKDRPQLKALDKRISSYRTAELLAHPLSMPVGFDYLKALHAQLFGDIFPSAGMIRRSTMQKHTEFCLPEYIESSAKVHFDKLRDEKYLCGISDIDEYINALAYYMGEMEALHPFMDGNGRSSRLFFHMLSLNAGYEIGWGSADPDHFLEANVAALDGDYQALMDVLEEIVIPLSND